MIQPTATEDSLIVRRHYNASPQRVYDAWTRVEQLSQWFGPSDDYSNPFLEADVRVGGRYRIGFQKEGDELNVVAGEYRVVEPPTKLVFTWAWEEPNSIAGAETLVTIELHAADGGTELVLTHEQFPNVEARDHHSMGWNGCLGRLANVVD